MFKKFLLVLLSLLLLLSLSFADEESGYERNDWNCNESNIEYFNQLLEDWSIFKNNKIITKDVFQVAIWQLEKYCNNENETMQTPIFTNQLIDIAFRKVDWIKGAAYGVKLDELWQQWRQWLNEIEKEADTDPKIIAKNFKKAWGSPEDNILPNNKTLYWKYMLACEEALAISDKTYSKLSQDNKNEPMNNASLRMACYKKAENKYNKERKMTEDISKHNFYNHADKKLYKSINEDFTKKWSWLIGNFSNILWDIEYVVRRFIHGTDVNTR